MCVLRLARVWLDNPPPRYVCPQPCPFLEHTSFISLGVHLTVGLACACVLSKVVLIMYDDAHLICPLYRPGCLVLPVYVRIIL
ncbi:hypothetical protein LZ31DRAFT_233280 [Colletotrichum somersetense]|nr:hypothetical protein LZ31DRAFT_233280 [Colletotrichum somersetense]